MGSVSKIELHGKENFKNIIDKSKSFAQVAREYNLANAGDMPSKVRKFAQLWNIDISHIENKYAIKEHKCERDGCNNITKNPRFCSQSCSAKVTNIGKKNPNRKIRYCHYDGCFEEVLAGRKYCCKEHRSKQKSYRVKNSLQKPRLTPEQKSANTKKSIGELRNERKKRYIDYCGGKCAVCGYDKYQGSLHFHHVNPDSKDRSVKLSGNCITWDRARNELDKCVLLCGNCHSEVHAGVTDLSNYVDLSKY